MDSFTVTYTNVAEVARLEAGETMAQEWSAGAIVHQSVDSEALVNDLKNPPWNTYSNCIIA